MTLEDILQIGGAQPETPDTSMELSSDVGCSVRTNGSGIAGDGPWESPHGCPFQCSQAHATLIRREASEICYYPDSGRLSPRSVGQPFRAQPPHWFSRSCRLDTKLTDRREKLQNHRVIDSVKVCASAAQDEHQLTIHRRADGWRPQVCAGAQAAAEFRSIAWCCRWTRL